jgi:hypothetical protein
LSEAKKKKNEIDKHEREDFLEKQERWRKFKKDKDKVILEYVNVKQKIKHMAVFIQLIKIYSYMKVYKQLISKTRKMRAQRFGFILKFFLFQRRFLKVHVQDRH